MIREIFLLLVQHEDGNQQIVADKHGDALIVTRREDLQILRAAGEVIAERSKKQVIVCEFSERRDHFVIEPAKEAE